MKKIFPDSILENSSAQVINDYNRNYNLIYLIVLFVVTATLISIFFIKIQIVVTANGIIKPQGERSDITAPTNGRVSMVKLQENSYVSKGDTLFIISPDNIMVQLPSLNHRKLELMDFINDLDLIIRGETGDIKLRSPVYSQEYISFKNQLKDYEYNVSIAEKNYLREEKLFKAGVISLYDFEEYKEKYEATKHALDIYKSKTLAQWQIERNQYAKELREVKMALSQLNVQSGESVVCAPLSGTIQKLENVSDGMYVHSGQKIVEISPEGDLIAECYISPKDIGLIRESQHCNIQIEAYNYNQWGLLTGHVREIFKDVQYVTTGEKQLSYYLAYCEIDSDKLWLKNGYEGKIKKGMTLVCRMIVTQRTVAQLLYDKLDNWLNPNLVNQL